LRHADMHKTAQHEDEQQRIGMTEQPRSGDPTAGQARGIRVARVVGRALLASLFILAALNKMANYNATAVRMDAFGLHPVALLLPLTIALELLGGLSVAFANRWAGLAAVLLAGFTLATNFVFHQFWLSPAELRPLELSLFFKNIAIAGALIYFAANQWRPSGDRAFKWPR
jgi:putative oxidoreductase